MPFDVKEILRSLAARPRDGEPAPEWLARSWADPDGFAAALTDFQNSGTPAKSRPGLRFDFFYDFAVRHAATNRVALRTWDKARGWQSLTYQELHDRAAQRASAWAGQRVKAGAKVCLVYQPGEELLVSMLAALRLGACIGYLPPEGREFVRRRIAAFAPDHLAAEPRQAPLFKGFEKLLLKSKGGGAAGFASHTYQPQDPVALVFSPLVDPCDRGVLLNADEAFRGALRDGLSTFGLDPGDVLAAAGFPLLQHLPALLFATLLRGATYLHLDLGDLSRDVSPLLRYPIRALGVSAELRDLLLRVPQARFTGLGHWFRNVEEPIDWIAWQKWGEQMGLKEVPTFNVLVDPAAGGAVLASARRPGAVHADIDPVPGRSWELRDLNLTGQPAPGDIGVFTGLPDKGRPLPYVVLSRVRGQLHYAGTRVPRRDGRVFPSAEVAQAVSPMPSVLGASVVAVPEGGVPSRARFILVVFVGGAKNPPSTADLQKRVELEVGPMHLPDDVKVFPLHPRFTKGRIDDVWCKAQYLTGALHEKSQDEIFLALTALRDELLAKQAPAGTAAE